MAKRRGTREFAAATVTLSYMLISFSEVAGGHDHRKPSQF
jgi:hypothetical protein